MSDMLPSVLFVGESPPPKAPLDFNPFDCDSGTRAGRHMLGLRHADARALFLKHCPRKNIFNTPTGPKGCPPWDHEKARERGGWLISSLNKGSHPGRDSVVVALGRQTAEALGLPRPAGPGRKGIAPVITTMWQLHGIDCLYLPHPSGQSKVLGNAATRAEVRRAVLPEVVAGIPTLRPWHFELGDPAVLADLGAALCPMQPDVGIAAALVAADLHRQHEVTFKATLMPWHHRVDSNNPIGTWCGGSGRGDTWGGAAEVTCPNCMSGLASGRADHPMRQIAEVLARDAGAHILSERWGLSPKRIESTARSQPAGATFDRAALRATIARYAAWGML